LSEVRQRQSRAAICSTSRCRAAARSCRRSAGEARGFLKALKFSPLACRRTANTKTPFKDIADAIGHGDATAISAELTELRMHVERVNAERRMAAKPTLDEEAEEALSDLIEQLDAGELENDPELKEIAMEAKREKQPGGACYLC
jgi:hypothetical protein